MSPVAASSRRDRRLSSRNLSGSDSFEGPERLVWLNPAWLALAAALGLSIMGIASISTTQEVGDFALPGRQIAFALIGLFAALAAAFIKPRTWCTWSYSLLALAIALLLLLLIPFVPHFLVRPINGARRWINLGLTDLQPSELAKVAFVMALAAYLRYRKNYRTLTGLLAPFAIMLIPMGLVLVEPDLGTALLFPPALFAMLLAAGAKLRHLLIIGGCGAGTALLIAVISVSAAGRNPPTYPLLEKHQVDRITALMNQIRGDTRQENTINYQGLKAVRLVGAGGMNGLGADRARVIVAFNKLPLDYNDMIFAVVVNRFGFVGGALMIGLYFLFAAAMLGSAALCRDPFGRLLCVGFTAFILLQMCINMGETMGVLPITGTTLPFVSYGGSSMIVSFIMTGMVLGVALRPPAYFERASFEFGDDEPPDVLSTMSGR